MKLNQLKEVRYAGSLEAEDVLYTLWKARNKIEKDNLSVVKIKDPFLSEKRAAAIARYAMRVIAPEALDTIDLKDEAQKLRDLPPDVDLDHARDAARAAGRAAARAYADTGIDLDVASAAAHAAYNTVDAANAVAHATAYAVDAATAATAAIDANTAYHSANAATAASRAANDASRAAGNKQRHLYHLNQMIKLAADIK